MGELIRSIATREDLFEPEELAERLKEGDEEAFAEVFQLYKDLIFNLSFSMLLDKSEALDVTQEVFLTLHRKIQQFRGESSLKTWLYRVTLNQASNRNRWWRRRQLHKTVALNLNAASDEERINLIARQPPPDREAASVEIRSALRAGLEQLPRKQRTAVVLRDMHGLNYREISSITGARVGTIKSRIARGRERLRRILAPYWQEMEP